MAQGFGFARGVTYDLVNAFDTLKALPIAPGNSSDRLLSSTLAARREERIRLTTLERPTGSLAACMEGHGIADQVAAQQVAMESRMRNQPGADGGKWMQLRPMPGIQDLRDGSCLFGQIARTHDEGELRGIKCVGQVVIAKKQLGSRSL